ncbi:hypothetical protein Ae406Ps2_5346 [Pseudonocardia sp. Ae406_Ps2]|nr:hypothetical protein Ae331Ps2_0609c [Pseudonocardia sp. Ae331_Ps2]OLM05346.1 hypothetical protein Ae406Ps2_5346 [Pseudonocardia sp. Ae406_Ps2]OLM15703.1 hypothetical protein Ae505Ps2_5835c [Pseudonocardia sp. Ae505_Ps2]
MDRSLPTTVVSEQRPPMQPDVVTCAASPSGEA